MGVSIYRVYSIDLSGKQLRTGSQTSNIYAPPREKVNRSAAASIIEVKKLIGDSIQVIIDGSSGTGNYHQAWPFLTYLVNNPDDVPGLGTPVYYSTHKVLPERQPRYMYCNIVPLTTSGATIVHVDIKHAEEAEFAAEFAVRAHFIVQLSGKGVLHHSAMNDWDDIISTCLRRSGRTLNIDQIDHSGRSALHYVSRLGNLNSFEMLIEGGASLILKERLGRTSVQDAADAGFKDCLMLLLQSG
ncbi:hypothetical protein ACKAV7_005367 [Fusarium commune]